MKEKKYLVLYSDRLYQLTNKINSDVEQGYLPDGDIVVSSNGDRDNNSPIFIQRMVMVLKEK